MNTWLKSFVIGAVASAITFFVFRNMARKRTGQEFTAQYELERKRGKEQRPANHDETIDELHKMSRVLQERCKKAGYLVHVKGLDNGEKLDVTIQGIYDTARVRKMITSAGKLEIHEVYTLQELTSIIMESSKDTERVSTKTTPVEDTVIDTGKAIKFSEQPSQPAKPVKSEPTLESVFTPGQQPEGAELGSVAVKDTAAFREIFKKESRIPADSRLYYGTSINSPNKLGVYVLRTYGEGSITIDNSDIKSAMQDFGYNNTPMVAFSFTEIGSRKWGMLTDKNVRRPLAILVDDIVVSAPTVESAILGGKATISGNFTVGETQVMADQLNSEAMPERFQIIKQEISRESSVINLRALFILLVAFAIGTGTSYLIFKLLKSN
jgi:SecD/SecF fusion protein